jgi:NAD(P)-dependent dehydrogenase (short-subunit alcohol dehydrogenase family)
MTVEFPDPGRTAVRDPWRLDGQVAVVTGAGRGLGRGCALELARAGASVVLAARTEADLEQVVDEIAALAPTGGAARPQALAVRADVSDEGQVIELIARAEAFGDLAVLVTAAGTNRPGAAVDYPIAAWDRLFDINVRATFLACRSFGARALARDAPASIVTMSSQMGSVGYPGRVAYCASKHAVDGLTRSLAVEWARDGIRVNAVAPTFVETPLTAPMLADPAFREEILQRRLPTGRLAQIDDVARAVRYLACDASSSVTGHILRVDGGWTAW